MDLRARLLKESLDATSLIFVGSDSQTVIQWCTTKSLELRAFEKNRVDLILKNSREKLPRYVSSS